MGLGSMAPRGRGRQMDCGLEGQREQEGIDRGRPVADMILRA